MPAAADATGTTFQHVQRQLAAAIRSPQDARHPAGVEPHRLGIYQKLIFNNFESLIGSGFPVLRSLYSEEAWRDLLRQFLQVHSCQSPYFLDVGKEFLDFLEQEHVRRDIDPAFLFELAHYEWVELVLDVATDEVPEDSGAESAVLDAHLVLSPLAWPLVYQYPVHRINAQFRPDAPSDEPTCLLVYRNRADNVQFIEINPLTVHLLQMLAENEAAHQTLSARQVLEQIAIETGYLGVDEFVGYGESVLASFRQLGIVAIAGK